MNATPVPRESTRGSTSLTDRSLNVVDAQRRGRAPNEGMEWDVNRQERPFVASSGEGVLRVL